MKKHTPEEIRALYDKICDDQLDPDMPEDEKVFSKALRDFIFNTTVNAPVLELEPIEPMEGTPNIELVYATYKYEKHPKTVKQYSGNLNQLAEDVGNLHYLALYDFLKLLEEKLRKDSVGDFGRDRLKLSFALGDASISIKNAAEYIKRAWDISEPFMKEDE